LSLCAPHLSGFFCPDWSRPPGLRQRLCCRLFFFSPGLSLNIILPLMPVSIALCHTPCFPLLAYLALFSAGGYSLKTFLGSFLVSLILIFFRRWGVGVFAEFPSPSALFPQPPLCFLLRYAWRCRRSIFPFCHGLISEGARFVVFFFFALGRVQYGGGITAGFPPLFFCVVLHAVVIETFVFFNR